MKPLLRKLVLIFLVMWLPLQGYAAATVVCVRHYQPAPMQMPDLQNQHAMADGHCDHGQEMPAATSQAPCDDCGSCHVIAPALLPAIIGLNHEAGFSFAFPFNMHFSLIFPEQPQRPPYSSLA